MPLITFAGPPCSGKSLWAQQLIEQLEQRIAAAQETAAPGHNYTIVYHNDETLGISREAYGESASEKHARGTQLSAVRRDLSRTTFVVLDSLAYIKGFRYQLFCEAKGVATPHCVVQVLAPPERCLAWNACRPPAARWDEQVVRQLAMRFEEPNGALRWDAPLFTVVSGADTRLPMDELWDALVLRRPPPPNAATLVAPAAGTDYLQELDRRTLAVVARVVQHQQLTGTGGRVVVDAAAGLCVEIPGDVVSTAQLQRVRRTFVALNRVRSIDAARVDAVFVEYLNKSLNE